MFEKKGESEEKTEENLEGRKEKKDDSKQAFSRSASSTDAYRTKTKASISARLVQSTAVFCCCCFFFTPFRSQTANGRLRATNNAIRGSTNDHH